MAKLRRITGKPATSKKPTAKPARKAVPAAKKKARPAAHKPTVHKPAAHKPAAHKPVVHKPVAHKPAAHKPAPKKPVAAKPVAGRKGAARPIAPPPPPRSTYAEAVGTYERAMQNLQAKRYRDAAQLLKMVISTYPEEKELLERAQLYLRVCERHLAPLDATPKTPEERVYAATLALNSGDAERAATLLTAAVAQDPSNDHAEYMLGVALTVRGNVDAAIAHLARAVALNPETRELIAKEPDLEAARQTEAVTVLLSTPPPQPPSQKNKEKRPAARARGSR